MCGLGLCVAAGGLDDVKGLSEDQQWKQWKQCETCLACERNAEMGREEVTSSLASSVSRCVVRFEENKGRDKIKTAIQCICWKRGCRGSTTLDAAGNMQIKPPGFAQLSNLRSTYSHTLMIPAAPVAGQKVKVGNTQRKTLVDQVYAMLRYPRKTRRQRRCHELEVGVRTC